MESRTKTIAKRARVEPRTHIRMTMKMLIYIMFVSRKAYYLKSLKKLKIWSKYRKNEKS